MNTIQPTSTRETRPQVWDDPATERQLSEWGRLYAQVFRLRDVRVPRIPERRAGFEKLIVVDERVTAERVLDACRKEFRCFNVWDLDKVFGRGWARPTSTYAVWVPGNVTDDERLSPAGVMFEEQRASGITILERLLHELVWYRQALTHLELGEGTLCTGSVATDGDRLPVVQWDDERHQFRVDVFKRDWSLVESFGVRRVVL
jgi:hypothetical protein